MRRRVLRVLVCVGLLSSLASSVFAHAALKSASPGPGDRVSGSPTELVAQFSQNLDPSKTSLEVRDASGARVARGGELGDGPREFRLELPVLTLGEYEVRWTTYSTEDDEVARDSYTFEVIAAPSPSPTATASPTPSAKPSASPTSSSTPTPLSTPPESLNPGSDTSGMQAVIDSSVVIPIVVVLVAAGGFGLWALRRPRA